MSYDNLWVVFNGEIYNFENLRSQLTEYGYEFISESDTEVVLLVYHYWRNELFSKLNGDFSIAIYDENDQSLILSSDRFGIKPLYYHSDNNKSLIFGSEIRFLSEFVLPVINTPYVLKYLFHSNIDFDSQTLFSEIKQFEPGTTLSFNVSTGVIRFKSYIQPVSYSSEHSIANLKSNLFNSVKLRLISDIGIGFLLSGGLDSNSLVSITKNIEQHGIDTNYNLFSIVFPGYFSSEDQELNLALKSYPSFQSHSFSYDANTLLTRLREVIKAQELPFRSISTVSQYLLHEYISTNSDSKVIMSGQGADEIFAGHHEHFFAYLLELLIKLKFFKFIQEFTQIKKILQTSSLRYIKLILVNWISLILKRYFFSKSKFITKKYNIKMSDFLLFSLKYNINFSTLKEYLRYEDENSMAFSLESRVPFLDTIIVEQVLSIDSQK